ncbi:hypothetical protein ACIGXM_28625 [Kitasatospora sp. NPDC052896]|uniref:hypothetical protein n=1 Tax=Kitasatospora sp. NPDC052896 TaxID=3364061 RepID=UPI0037C60950
MAGPDERLAPQPLPELSGGKVATAQVEQALLTALAEADTDGQVVRADRYSTRPTAPAVGYGITVDTADTWRLFIPGGRIIIIPAGHLIHHAEPKAFTAATVAFLSGDEDFQPARRA